METFLIAIGSLVPMLLLLVVVHELGHYFTARSLGVKVLEFGVGFPPRAFGLYTGKTRVVISHDTRFVNLDGPAALQLGRLVKVTSSEDSEGNLVARVIEAPAAGRGVLSRIKKKVSGGAQAEDAGTPEPEGSDEWLKHEGRVRAVEDGSFVLADMLYSVNWAPLGGFVRLAGESNPAVPRSLAAKGVGTRFLVLVAGPLMNAILPIALFTILLMLPQDVLVGQVEVTGVTPGSPAQVAGVQKDDVIVRAGGQVIENPSDLLREVNINGGSQMEWLIDRGGRQLIFQLQPRFERPPGKWRAGIFIGDQTGRLIVTGVNPESPAGIAGILANDVVVSAGGTTIESVEDLTEAIKLNEGAVMDWLIDRGGLDQVIQVTPRLEQPEAMQWLTGESSRLINAATERRSDPPWVAFRDSFVETWELMVLVKQGLSGAFSSGSAPQLSGPVGIAKMAGEVTQEVGPRGWVLFTILLSINLAVLNILPIPMLDGGRLVFVVLEWVRRGKRVPPDKEGMVHLIGFAALIGLILLITANDISRLVQGQSFLGG
jgi:regulator of sigma E protease